MEDLMIPTAVLDAVSMRAIHRDGDTFIALGRKNSERENGFQNLGSIQASKLESMLPGFADYLIRDSYFSVNGFYHPHPTSTCVPLNLPYTIRRQTRLRRLNACYVDLDVGRPEEGAPHDMDVIQARSRAFAMMQMGIIPDASIFCFSGRGLYLLWLLNDEEDPSMPQRAWPEKTVLWKQINAALSDRLLELAADRSVRTDPVRVLRIPGSINSKSAKAVNYTVSFGADSRIISYSLRELANFLGINALETHAALRYWQVKNRHSVPNRRRGYEAVNEGRMTDIGVIEQHRGGFLKRGLQYSDGTISTGRLRALTIYATILRRTDHTPEEALKSLNVMASNCRPAYPSDPNDISLETLVKNTYSNNSRPWRDETICDHLGISPELAEELELENIVPPLLRKKRNAERVTQDQVIAHRRILVKHLFTVDNIKTCRALALACTNRGYKASRQTVVNDLEALGFKSAHRGGRPSKRQESLPFEAQQVNSIEADILERAQAKLMKKRQLLSQ